MIVEIVEALKDRTQSTFGGRVAAAAEFALLAQDGRMDLPSAYVMPLDDVAADNKSDNGYSQVVTDSVAIVVVIDNKADDLSKSSVAQLLGIRNSLINALCAWSPGDEHGPISYVGGAMLEVNRAHLYYQFEFQAETEYREEHTHQATANDALDNFERVGFDVDLKDPSINGEPDGDVEVDAVFEVSQT